MVSKKFVRYEVEFWDHSVGEMEEVRCRIVGYLLKETKTYMRFTFWLVDTDDEKLLEHNLEPFSIRKAAIIKRRKLA